MNFAEIPCGGLGSLVQRTFDCRAQTPRHPPHGGAMAHDARNGSRGVIYGVMGDAQAPYDVKQWQVLPL
jgi:hypothetical protein